MIIFSHIPKTAGTSFKFILRNTFGVFHCDVNRSRIKPFNSKALDITKKLFPSIKSISGHNLIDPTNNLKETDGFFVTFLREPVKRCVSHYQDNCVRGNNKLSLEEWLSDKEVQNLQVKQIAGEDDLEKAKKIVRDEFSFVGLTEKFNESLKLIKMISPYPLNVNYKKKIVAKDNRIKNEILNNKDQVDLVKKYNGLDIDLYEYVSKQLYPEMLRKYSAEISKAPEVKYYKSELTLSYLTSKYYNKLFYKTMMKLIQKAKK